MRKLLALFAVALLGGFLGARVSSVHAQTTAVLQFSGSWSTHTSCTPVTGQTSICLASDGLWQSINGGAFTQVGGAGVTSIAVNGGTAQTGAVALTIPSKASGSVTLTLQ